MTDAEPDIYVVERIREALAHDPRVAALGLTVSVAGDTVVLTGDVATPERKAVAADVAAELAPGRTVRNALSVVPLVPVDAEETIP